MGLETGFRRSGRVRLPESVREAFWVAVISDGLSISQVAEKFGVSRQTLHAWLARIVAGREARLCTGCPAIRRVGVPPGDRDC
jgi:transposase-like protein